jgi:tRNA-dihydrouridine synthase B
LLAAPGCAVSPPARRADSACGRRRRPVPSRIGLGATVERVHALAQISAQAAAYNPRPSRHFSLIDPMRIGPYELANRVFVAPMAGISDRPYRALCRRLGAGYAVSEMAASNPSLWASGKTARRLDHDGEAEPRAVQLVGADPQTLAQAARYNVARGAQIIDLNMGCPAKKVCNVASGSALLRDEPLVERILNAVVEAVAPTATPVTLKYRTGWDAQQRNAVTIARIAERAGIAMLTLHGRTRACGFRGSAEYETIAQVKRAVSIPVVANGDIDSPARARAVLAATGADAIMVGRAAQGRPWIFREIDHHLRTGGTLPPPSGDEARAILLAHLDEHYRFYGAALGLRSARKHIVWSTRALAGGAEFCAEMNRIDDCRAQARALDRFLRQHVARYGRLTEAQPVAGQPPQRPH